MQTNKLKLIKYKQQSFKATNRYIGIMKKIKKLRCNHNKTCKNAKQNPRETL